MYATSSVVNCSFFGIKLLVRFMPVAIFANLCISILGLFANKNRWYKNKNPFFSVIDLSYIFGAHFVATLWVFKLTYGSFSKYFILNIVFDWINAFPFAGMWKKAGLFKFKKMSPSMYWCITSLLSIILYGYQYIIEKVIRQTNSSQ